MVHVIRKRFFIVLFLALNPLFVKASEFSGKASGQDSGQDREEGARLRSCSCPQLGQRLQPESLRARNVLRRIFIRVHLTEDDRRYQGDRNIYDGFFHIEESQRASADSGLIDQLQNALVNAVETSVTLSWVTDEGRRVQILGDVFDLTWDRVLRSHGGIRQHLEESLENTIRGRMRTLGMPIERNWRTRYVANVGRRDMPRAPSVSRGERELRRLSPTFQGMFDSLHGLPHRRFRPSSVPPTNDPAECVDFLSIAMDHWTPFSDGASGEKTQ